MWKVVIAEEKAKQEAFDDARREFEREVELVGLKILFLVTGELEDGILMTLSDGFWLWLSSEAWEYFTQMIYERSDARG